MRRPWGEKRLTGRAPPYLPRAVLDTVSRQWAGDKPRNKPYSSTLSCTPFSQVLDNAVYPQEGLVPTIIPGLEVGGDEAPGCPKEDNSKQTADAGEVAVRIADDTLGHRKYQAVCVHRTLCLVTNARWLLGDSIHGE